MFLLFQSLLLASAIYTLSEDHCTRQEKMKLLQRSLQSVHSCRRLKIPHEGGSECWVNEKHWSLNFLNCPINLKKKKLFVAWAVCSATYFWGVSKDLGCVFLWLSMEQHIWAENDGLCGAIPQCACGISYYILLLDLQIVQWYIIFC